MSPLVAFVTCFINPNKKLNLLISVIVQQILYMSDLNYLFISSQRSLSKLLNNKSINIIELSQQVCLAPIRNIQMSTHFDLIVARSLNHAIGLNGKLPWHIPQDLKMFRKITCWGPHKNSIIMGRKTHQSIGKVLPNRLNIVISKEKTIKQTNDLKQARSLEQALKLSKAQLPQGRIFVTGGAKIFQESLDSCRFIYQTLINKQTNGDVFMPKHNHPCRFVSKTHNHQNFLFDYRQYYNNKIQNQSKQNLFGQPEHQQYQYLKMIKNIIENGDTKMDRTGTGTKSIFGGMMRYDLSETFPLLTHKKVFWRGVVQELLWFISGSTNAKILQQKNIHIWDGNSSKQYLQSIGINRQAGDLGPVYGFQWRNWNAPYTTINQNYQGKGIDQLKWIINQIKTNPNNRRLIMSAWNPSQLKQMALPPCHLLCQFHVSSDNRLNCSMYQRSCDMGLGVPFNIASYALLTCLIAQVTRLKRGQFVHMLGDMHVYNDHIQPLQNIDKIAPFPFPILQINKDIKEIDKFKYQDIKIKEYKSHPKISMKMSV